MVQANRNCALPIPLHKPVIFIFYISLVTGRNKVSLYEFNDRIKFESFLDTAVNKMFLLVFLLFRLQPNAFVLPTLFVLWNSFLSDRRTPENAIRLKFKISDKPIHTA